MAYTEDRAGGVEEPAAAEEEEQQQQEPPPIPATPIHTRRGQHVPEFPTPEDDAKDAWACLDFAAEPVGESETQEEASPELCA